MIVFTFNLYTTFEHVFSWIVPFIFIVIKPKLLDQNTWLFVFNILQGPASKSNRIPRDVWLCVLQFFTKILRRFV